MKRSHSSSATSSSSSSAWFENNNQIRPKRQRRNQKTAQKCDNQKANSPINGRRSSIYRGVTKHRWTGRFEAHLWDKSSWNNIQNKKGRQVYLGAYDSEEAAARTYDLAALKYWGPNTTLNFSIENYEKELEEMQNVSREEYLSSLRRQSSGFARGVSKYRGVARHHHNGRWEARIGRVFGNKYLYLGTYNTQEEAAMAYDMAAIEYRGLNAVTNFDISKYVDKIKKKPEKAQTETKIEAQEVLNSCDSEEAQVDQKHHQQQQQQHRQEVDKTKQLQLQPQQLESTEILISEESSLMTGIDPLIEQDFQWGFMDNGLPPLEVSSTSFEKNWDLVLDMFGNGSFEDDLDLIFKSGPDENEFGFDAIMDSPKSNGDNIIGASTSTSMENNGQHNLVCSSTSSPASSTASVSCNYSQ